MKKGIAINTILLLVIGLLTIGIIAYVVYQSFTGSSLSREECRAKMISHCTSCSIAKWPPSNGPTVGTLFYEECSTFISNLVSGQQCNDIYDICKGYIPVGPTTTV